MTFLLFLIERINNPENEADVILHQIISNVDESHVYYSDHRLDFNIGIMCWNLSQTPPFSGDCSISLSHGKQCPRAAAGR